MCVCATLTVLEKLSLKFFFYEQENDSLVGGNSMGQPSSKQV